MVYWAGTVCLLLFCTQELYGQQEQVQNQPLTEDSTGPSKQDDHQVHLNVVRHVTVCIEFYRTGSNESYK
jgi:hypothetical protein